MAVKIYKCVFCKFTSTDKYTMGKHYHTKHKDMIRPDMTGYQWFYYLITGKERGSCIVCKSPTDFNEGTMKYSRFCNNPKCKQKYRDEFKGRMISKYGKIHLLDDPEKQKEMLAARSISGTYKWHDGSATFPYTGSYELHFLHYIDNIMSWPSTDILFPSPHIFTYPYQGKNHFYIPDGFVPSLNLEIEIKDDGSAKQINQESREKDKIKEELMRSNETYFRYIKIVNKNYEEFVRLVRGV